MAGEDREGLHVPVTTATPPATAVPGALYLGTSLCSRELGCPQVSAALATERVGKAEVPAAGPWGCAG